MESFYGGRQGISFIIVKRFDGIDIPKDTSFTVKYFAFDTKENNFILDENNNPIERTNDTYKLYNDWKLHEKDGSSITYKEKEGVFPFQYAEGMVQCFSQGGITTNIVNYGEYVIIDAPNKNDLDNGKVYKRGLDYQNDLGGAEYIGQIVGPQGNSPEIEIDSFTTLINAGNPHFEFINNDIIPGVELDNKGNPKYDEHGNPVKGNNIQSSWVTIRDKYGVVTGCKIGFQFPYHIFSFISERTNAYTTSELITREDDGTLPYFSKWKIAIPRGIKGDALGDVHIVNGFAKAGAKYYEDVDCTKLIPDKKLEQDMEILISDNSYDESKPGRPIADPHPVTRQQIIRYVRQEDTYKEVLIYKVTNFDENEKGKITYIKIGDYNIIKDIQVKEDGSLEVEYTNKETKIFKKQIKWLDNITLSKDGNLQVKYNIDEKDAEATIINENPIQWIEDIDIDTDEIKKIYDDEGNVINETSWGEGTGSQKLKIKYNNEEGYTKIGNPINYIIECVVTKNRINLSRKYRENENELESLLPEVAENGHLLVIYSDPELRKNIPDSHKKLWQSTKITNKKIIDEDGQEIIDPEHDGWFNEWYDLGPVQGTPGGILVYQKMTAEEAKDKLEKEDDEEKDISPEAIFEDERYAGWMVGIKGDNDNDPVTIKFYDYVTKQWYTIDEKNDETIKPSNVMQIRTSVDDIDEISVKEDGFVLIKDTNKNIIKHLLKRSDKGFNTTNPYYFSSSVKYIDATTNMGVNTLEEQLLIGFNTITEEWIDETDNNVHVQTKFVQEEVEEYYILHSIIYAKTNIVNNIIKRDILSIYQNNEEKNIFEKVISQSMVGNKKVTKETINSLLV